MKQGWDVKELGKVCEIFNGLWKGKKPPFIEVGVIRNTNFTKDGFLDDSDIAFLPVEAKQFVKRKLQYGDIILEKSGGGPKQPVGRVIPFDKKTGEFSFSNFTSVIRINNRNQLNFIFLHRFLFWMYVSGITETMQRRSTGIRNLQLKEYKEIPIPIPPLPEQQRIVKILDKAFVAIDKAKQNAEQNLKNAKAVFESYLQGVFDNKGDDWEKKTLGEICLIKHGFAFKSKYFSTKGNYIVLTPGSFYEKGGFRDQGAKTKYYSDEIPNGYILNKGDFLFAMTEQAAGLLGSSLIVPKSNYFLHNQRLGLVLINDGIVWDNDFFFHQFNTVKFRTAVQDTASGVKVRHTSPNKLREISIVFPLKLVEQKDVSNKLNSLNSKVQQLETIYQQKLANLAELKKSILQKAFRGEL